VRDRTGYAILQFKINTTVFLLVSDHQYINFIMKYVQMKWFSKVMMLVGILFLTACAVPKYSYEKEDAGTVFLSLTSNLALSRAMSNWSIDFEAISESARNELPRHFRGFEVSTSTRSYGANRSNGQKFNIDDIDRFGDVHLSHKIPPGRYRIRFFYKIDAPAGNNMPSTASTLLINQFYAVDEKSIFPLIKPQNTSQAFPDIQFIVEPGKAVYLGAFNAGMFACKNELGVSKTCMNFEVSVIDEFLRDSKLLKDSLAKRAETDKFELVNRVLKVDRTKSPKLYSTP
jgi:hypothetical protein